MRDTRPLLDQYCDTLRRPGRRSWFIAQPSSRGDTYLTCALMEAFRAEHARVSDDIVLLVKASHAPIAQMFDKHVSRIVLVDDAEMDALALQLVNLGARSALVPDQLVLVAPRLMDDGRADALTQLPEFSQKTMYQQLLRLPLNAKLSQPVIPEAWRKEALEFAAAQHMPAGRSVILLPDANSFPLVEDRFWEQLARGLREAGWAVFTNLFGKNGAPRGAPLPGTAGISPPFHLLLPLAEHAGWVVSTLTGGMNILISARANCRKTVVVRGPAPGTRLAFHDLIAPLDGAFPYGYQKTFDGEVYDIEEIEIREAADFEPVVRRICSGLNARGKQAPAPEPMMQLCAETSPGDVLDRITILELKEDLLSGTAALHNVRRELTMLRTRIRPSMSPPRADLKGIVADLKAVNQAAWNTNELIFKGFADSFGEPGWQLDTKNAEELKRSEEMIRAFRESQRLNRQRVSLKTQINRLLGYHTIEEKSYDDPLLRTAGAPARVPVVASAGTPAVPAAAAAPAWSAVDVDGRLAEAGLHAIQFDLSAPQRDAVAAAMVQTVNRFTPRLGRPTDAAALHSLREHGLAGLDKVLTPSQVSEIVRHLSRTPCYNAHVPAYSDGVARSVAEAARKHVYGSYKLQDALAAPHLLELAMNEKIVALCEHYLGCLPTLYSVHVWWTFAGPGAGTTHSYHRDQDDHRFLSLFTYLTDVGPQDGPIDFLVGTHRPEVVQEALLDHARRQPNQPVPDPARYFPQFAGNGYDTGPGKVPIPYETLFERHKATLTGDAGTAFLADTFALHRGNPPTGQHRLACWIRYGLSKHRCYVMDGTSPVPASQLGGRLPATPEAAWISRLIVDPKR